MGRYLIGTTTSMREVPQYLLGSDLGYLLRTWWMRGQQTIHLVFIFVFVCVQYEFLGIKTGSVQSGQLDLAVNLVSHILETGSIAIAVNVTRFPQICVQVEHACALRSPSHRYDAEITLLFQDGLPFQKLVVTPY